MDGRFPCRDGRSLVNGSLGLWIYGRRFCWAIRFRVRVFFLFPLRKVGWWLVVWQRAKVGQQPGTFRFQSSHRLLMNGQSGLMMLPLLVPLAIFLPQTLQGVLPGQLGLAAGLVPGGSFQVWARRFRVLVLWGIPRYGGGCQGVPWFIQSRSRSNGSSSCCCCTRTWYGLCCCCGWKERVHGTAWRFRNGG